MLSTNPAPIMQLPELCRTIYANFQIFHPCRKDTMILANVYYNMKAEEARLAKEAAEEEKRRLQEQAEAEKQRLIEEEKQKKIKEQELVASQQKYERLKDAVYNKIVDSIKLKLKCPSTAKVLPSIMYKKTPYSELSDMTKNNYGNLLKQKDAEVYYVYGEVDAQNGYGAMIRSSWYGSICFFDITDEREKPVAIVLSVYISSTQ